MIRCIVKVDDQYVTERGFTSSIDRAKVFPSKTAARNINGGEVIPVALICPNETFTVTLCRIDVRCAVDDTNVHILPEDDAIAKLQRMTQATDGPFAFKQVASDDPNILIYENRMHQTIRVSEFKVLMPLDSITF